ncbi:DUF2490 domain-containing protein [Flavobacterium branchiophilum]|uniref:DUF2490 domain-containing protein n=1 Tax=Flavobacterium branchiophilum TaxID=55197 RepID=A0A2H3KR32_9FLAO|nr:DUF2490 domain-containing protein [Flavobacterium branchiophilum]PDS24342.1 hypothetical protein B0A77_08425 [Flavobacterium branchiophilum]
MMKKTALILFWILLFQGIMLHAQAHSNSWFRATLSVPVTEKIKTELEYQHRRQNGFNNLNRFDKVLMNSIRTWVYYKPNKEITYSVSPFAYFENYKIIQNIADADAMPSKEYRMAVALEWQHEMFQKTFLVNRTALEYRIFDGSTPDVLRPRNRLSIRYDVNSKINCSVGDEILINASHTDATHFFDHNRLFFNLGYKINSSMKLDLGYMHISRLPKTNGILIEENNLIVNFTYSIQKSKNKK